ncbi:MAG: ABC-F family ATP-binding cassette domain-containing protein [Chitinophagales bacterium]
MLRINNVSIHFGGKPLFDKMTFQIVKGERIGLTGKNGAGKSTLLNMIMGHLSPSEGNLETPTTYSIGHLSQDLDEVSDLTVLEEAKKAFVALNNLEAEIEEVQNQLVTRTDYESDSYMSLINDLTEKEQLLHQLGGQNTEELIEKVLKGLGFVSNDMTKLVSSLSGGWQMRVELAKILLQQPDLILLDEPTNHLDIESIIWLEEYLTTYPGSVLVVSHDKAFLDNVTNRTIEIVLGKIEDYKCNYSKYLVQRQERIEKQQQAKKNQEDFIKQTERNIEKFRAKASKAKFAQSLIKKLDKLEVIEVDGSDNSSMNFKFQEPNRSGDIVVKVENASKAFGDNQVLKNVNLEINRGEKVAFVGKNGMGKTTLARMILNEIDYDGNINLGHNVEVGFFAQHQAEILDGNRTVFETIDDAATNEMRTRVRSLLGSFLFSGDDTEKKVKVLSGGERNRLALCKMLLEPCKFIGAR